MPNLASSSTASPFYKAGHRSVLPTVEEAWVWCPHCGLRRELAALKPLRELSLDGQRWGAIVCPRCHARERVRLPAEAATKTVQSAEAAD